MKKDNLRGKLEEVNQQISTLEQTVQEKWTAFEQKRDQFVSAGNDANRTDSEEFKAAEQIHKEYASAAAELKQLEGVRNGVFSMLAETGQPTFTNERRDNPDAEGKSFGQRALKSPEYKGLLESGALQSDMRHFNVTLAEPSVAEYKTLITGLSDTSGGAFITNQRVGYVEQAKRAPRIVDLITVGDTGVDAVEYARQTTFTNVAAETAEATATTTGTKPEATIAFEKVTETVKTIAHWVPATRRALADAGQLRTIIDSQLRYGLTLRLEDQLINGNGSGENFTGILNTSNVGTRAKAENPSDAIHKAITVIRLTFNEPNGIAMHPTDWELVRLSRDDGGSVTGTGAYLYGPPSQAVQPTMWGLPVAVTTAVPDDTALVGDFTKAVLWMREGGQILATDSHSDFFVKNLVAILAEMRAAFGVLMPTAFCKVTSYD